MQKLRYILFLLSVSTALGAQTFSISGTVTDTSGTALEGGTVLLLQARDSVLQHFGWSDKTDTFTFKKVKTGDYILQITHLGYQNYYLPLTIADAIVLAPVSLQAQVNDLDEVLVEGKRIPMAIKKDTRR